MTEEPIYKTKFMTNHFRDYHNRLEIEITHFPFPTSKEIIPFRNISEIKRPFSRPMEIHTNDGKKHRLNITGKAADELQEKINENI